MELHGVDPLQFTGPVLSLVLRDVWTEETADGTKVQRERDVMRTAETEGQQDVLLSRTGPNPTIFLPAIRTERQLEANVQQNLVRSRVDGSTDLVLLHQDL